MKANQLRHNKNRKGTLSIYEKNNKHYHIPNHSDEHYSPRENG